jgi:Bacterial pre-peptidase C-terminal domain
MSIRHAIGLQFFVLILAAALPLWAECETATAVTLNATYRSSGDELLKVTAASTGVLTFDVASPAAAAGQPKVTFLGTSCTTPTGEGTSFTFIQETPAWLTLDVASAGTYYLEVEPQDPQQTLGDFKLLTGWAASPTTLEEESGLTAIISGPCTSPINLRGGGSFEQSRFVIAPDAIDQWDDDIMRITASTPGVVAIDVVNPESDPVTATIFGDDECAAAAQLGEATLTPSSTRLAATMYSSDHTLKLVPADPESTVYEVAVHVYPLCGLGETDDHGDTALCATAIEVDGSDDGEIDNADEDDEDFFTFAVASQQSIEIESTGGTDTYGSLYDASGQRLESDDDGGTDSNFRISRTLGAGRYFIRVEGAGGAEGSYGIEVSVAP